MNQEEFGKKMVDVANWCGEHKKVVEFVAVFIVGFICGAMAF